MIIGGLNARRYNERQVKRTVSPAERCNLAGLKRKSVNLFKFVAFMQRNGACLIIWLNTAYYTTKVTVINTESSIYIKLLK